MALTADAMLKHAGNTSTREVHVPEWADGNGDDVVLVRSMTAGEFDVYSAKVSRNNADDKEPSSHVSATLIARCVVNADGSRAFKDDQINALAQLKAGPVQNLTKAILDQSGLTDEGEKEIRGNSDAAQGGNSSSE